MEPKRTYHITRKQALSMEEVVAEYIRTMRIAAGLNTQRVFAAWDVCSGAAPFTLKRFYRGGVLYITLSSSMVRDQLWFQKDLLVEKMNTWLTSDTLFTDDNRSVGFNKDLVLR